MTMKIFSFYPIADPLLFRTSVRRPVLEMFKNNEAATQPLGVKTGVRLSPDQDWEFRNLLWTRRTPKMNGRKNRLAP